MTFIPPSVPAPLRPEVEALLADVELFCQLHTVQDKDTKRPVPFVPLPMQARIFAAVQAGHKRIAIIKARQVAATTGCKMVLQHLLYSTPYEAQVALLSLRTDSAQKLIRENRGWLSGLPRLLQRPLRTSNASELVLDDTGASLKAFTTRSLGGGLRGENQTIAAVVSEFAYAPDQAEVLKQVEAAVGDKGLLIIESTAKQPGDLFNQIITGAPDNDWHLLTMWWWEHPAYRDDRWPDDFADSLSDEERTERELYGLDLDQLYWRRRKVLRIGGVENFRTEYPASLDDCFLSVEGRYFDPHVLNSIEAVPFSTPKKELERPHPHDRYVMGVDVGGGVGRDYSALCVVSLSTMQPVYVERNNQLPPAQWAHRCVSVATRYNQALLLCESNNHGHAVELELDHVGYTQRWRAPKTGRPWTTTTQSKLQALEALRSHFEVITRMDRATWLELRSLTIPAGKATPEAPQGAHDDLAMAAALAYRCIRDVPPSWRTSALQSTRQRAEALLDKSRARRLRSRSTPFG